MENNNRDFMKNRPPAAFANQAKDVFGSQHRSTRTAVTALLILLMIVLIIVSIVNANWYTLGIFSFVLLALIVSLIIGRRADRYNMPVQPKDEPDAIFKEHDI